MRRRIVDRIGIEYSPRIDVIHNWADGTDIQPLTGAHNPFVIENNLQDSFVVLFSGNFGRVNEFSTVLEAARFLRARREIVFLFVGAGAREDEIREFSRSQGLENIRLLPYQPKDRLRYSLGAGHASLVTVAEGLAGLCVPSKAYAIMAAGRPLLFVGDTQSDVARLIGENNCGAVVPSGESQLLAEIISTWCDSKSEIEQLGSAARSLFEERFSRDHAINYYLETLAKCILTAASLDAPQQRKTAIKDTAS
jgi:glycosyltransferase involved in cell wall biosynthesis